MKTSLLRLPYVSLVCLSLQFQSSQSFQRQLTYRYLVSTIRISFPKYENYFKMTCFQYYLSLSPSILLEISSNGIFFYSEMNTYALHGTFLAQCEPTEFLVRFSEWTAIPIRWQISRSIAHAKANVSQFSQVDPVSSPARPGEYEQ